MHYTMESLINSKPIAEHYTAAVNHWRQVLAPINPEDAQAVAKVAQAEQMWFEQNCGGRWPGQEVMVWSGICQYYTTAVGFEGNLAKAQAMYKGLLGSGCSMEIHSHAQEVAKLYEEIL